MLIRYSSSRKTVARLDTRTITASLTLWLLNFLSHFRLIHREHCPFEVTSVLENAGLLFHYHIVGNLFNCRKAIEDENSGKVGLIHIPPLYVKQLASGRLLYTQGAQLRALHVCPLPLEGIYVYM